jgi:hypothetical protein
MLLGTSIKSISGLCILPSSFIGCETFDAKFLPGYKFRATVLFGQRGDIINKKMLNNPKLPIETEVVDLRVIASPRRGRGNPTKSPRAERGGKRGDLTRKGHSERSEESHPYTLTPPRSARGFGSLVMTFFHRQFRK